MWEAEAVECLAEPAGAEAELAWLDEALAGRGRAVLWHGAQGLVAPLSYRRHAGFDAACAEFARDGWPVRLRRSGGGVVPQGAGILNLSLAAPVAGPPGDVAPRLYADLCVRLAAALEELGIDARPGAVEGSFCDGRFNLAVAGRKIAGTAQYWRRGAGARQAVLAHALLLVDADVQALAARASAFEAALGSERRYRADALTTVVREARAAPADPMQDLRRRLDAALRERRS
ncbi:MAG TPA: lipoate--protein ligase family protein [Ideonella sp.]|nr:lipoate--protein ligase family protein [Ideonella sp.]